jgi:membrane-bound lytic murein transglycosylase B
VRAAQIYLTYKGFNVGAIDGVNGANTVTAVKAFQASIGAPATGIADAALLKKLSA